MTTVRHLGPEVCQRPLDDLRPDQDLFSAVLDGCQHVDIPWHRKQSASVTVQPLEMFSLRHHSRPRQRVGQLRPCPIPRRDRGDLLPQGRRPFHQDRQEGRFDLVANSIGSGGNGGWNATATNAGSSPRTRSSRRSGRSRPALAPTWRYSTFCKTQYASRPGVRRHPQLHQCHLCVIHLLDRIGQLPTMKVEINDEGKYGRSYYTDDPWAEKRVYTWHDGKYDVKALVQEVGEWNEMIAATFGAMNDMLKASGSELSLGIADFCVPGFRASGIQGPAEPRVPCPLPPSHEATGRPAAGR